MDYMKRLLPLYASVSLICLLIYTLMQQNLRISANDPQIQMAEDTVGIMSSGKYPMEVTEDKKVDMAASLAPFLIIYDDSGTPILSSATLNGIIPIPPSGVFSYVRQHGEERLTWQPQRGVRIAAVVERYTGKSSGFVIAGRSLREVERRDVTLFHQMIAGWIIIIAAITVIPLILP